MVKYRNIHECFHPWLTTEDIEHMHGFNENQSLLCNKRISKSRGNLRRDNKSFLDSASWTSHIFMEFECNIDFVDVTNKTEEAKLT